MKKKIIRTTVVFVLLGMATSLFASTPRATLKNIQGKVEIKTALNQSWVPAKEGMTIQTMTTISTGFDSSVTLEMDENSVFVKPLTRMTLDQLLEQQGTVKTSCYLRVGAVKASVKSAEGVKQEFQVQSPYSTASVRGTVFEYDGLKLNVLEGQVSLVPGRPTRIVQKPVIMEETEEDVDAELEDTDLESEDVEQAFEELEGEDLEDKAEQESDDIAEEAVEDSIDDAAEKTTEEATESEAKETETPVIQDPDFSADFVGAPAVEADASQEIFVPAGANAEIKVERTGINTQFSGDESVKKQNATVSTSDSDTEAGGTGQNKPAGPKYGSVVITITEPK